MVETDSPLRLRRSDEIEYEAVEAATDLEKGVLINEEHGAKDVAIRRFTLAAGGEVPEHTNEVEHAQYVLEGEYTVGVDDSEYTVSAGDSLHIPAGTVHWYRNDSDSPGAFICAVPTGDDEISLQQ